MTDPKCNAASGRSLVEAVREAVEGGATVVQVRGKRRNRPMHDGVDLGMDILWAESSMLLLLLNMCTETAEQRGRGGEREDREREKVARDLRATYEPCSVRSDWLGAASTPQTSP